jgi:hypothetical protein
MKVPSIFALVFILLASSVTASVIASTLTEQKCGNGIKEGYELCEPDTAYDLCPSIGRVLKIAMVCDERNCACLPGESAKDCGNGIKEGVEMCENDKKNASWDFCPNISQIIGLPLKCDPESCDCVAAGAPVKISYCGDGKVEGNEDCEVDDDCPRGRTCQNCSCIREEQDLNLTPIQHNITTDEIPIPTVEDIVTDKSKTQLLGFVLQDYIGDVIPKELNYFDEENINIIVAMAGGANVTVSVATREMVVQEVHPEAAENPTMEVWLDEAAAAKVKDSDKRAETIITMLTDGSIRYRPTGFFRRIWFWLFTPF